MFDLGWSKVLILAVVAIVVVGPKELPSLLRTLGQFISQLRRHAAEFRAQFDDAMKSAELDQIKKDVEAIKTDTQASLRGIERSIDQDMSEAKASVDKSFETVEPRTFDDSTSPMSAPDSAAQTESVTPPQTLPELMVETAPVHSARPADPLPAKTGA
jgi:sec-independent protein translocase protein TatB